MRSAHVVHCTDLESRSRSHVLLCFEAHSSATMLHEYYCAAKTVVGIHEFAEVEVQLNPAMHGMKGLFVENCRVSEGGILDRL